MNTTNLKTLLQAYGPETRVAYVRWAPSGDATQTLTDAHGVVSVTRSGAGVYTVNLAVSPKEMIVVPEYIENDTTNYHYFEVTATDKAAKTVSVRHRTHAYASATSSPTASDTVDELQVLIFMRVAS